MVERRGYNKATKYVFTTWENEASDKSKLHSSSTETFEFLYKNEQSWLFSAS